MLILYIICLLIIMLYDIFTYTIPNLLNLGLFVLYFILFYSHALPTNLQVIWNGPLLIKYLIVISMLMTVFYLNLWGGGDSKMAMVLCLYHINNISCFFIITFCAGGLLGVVYLMLSKIYGFKLVYLPYGVALGAASLILSFYLSPLNMGEF